MAQRKFDEVFRIAAVLFFIAALYHFIGVIAPGVVIPSPRWRHGIFVIVNATGIWLILRRPPWVVFPFAVVTVQQLCSHLHRAWNWWHTGHRIDWISYAVVIVLPVLLVVLGIEVREQLNRDRVNC